MTSRQNIRFVFYQIFYGFFSEIGSDIEANSLLLSKGTELGAAELALLASFGPEFIQIYKVCVFEKRGKNL